MSDLEFIQSIRKESCLKTDENTILTTGILSTNCFQESC